MANEGTENKGTVANESFNQAGDPVGTNDCSATVLGFGLFRYPGTVYQFIEQ